MAELKTKANSGSVDAFLGRIEHQRKRSEAQQIVALMEEISGEKPTLWGDRMIGFGTYRYRQKSGQQAQWPLTAFAPSKARMTIYIIPGFSDYREQLARLGKHRTGKSCLYINKLADIDIEVLRDLIEASVQTMRTRYSAP